MERKEKRKAARKAQISELLKQGEEEANLSAEEDKQRKREQDKRNREATREMVRKQAEKKISALFHQSHQVQLSGLVHVAASTRKPSPKKDALTAAISEAATPPSL